MSEVKTSADPRTIVLADRDNEEKTYFLLSGNPDEHHGITTAIATPNGGVDIRSWYWSTLTGAGYVSDPESGIWIDGEDFRGLAEAIPILLQQIAASRDPAP
jgi:hypothetical protein